MRTTEPLLWLRGAGHERGLGAQYRYDCRKRSDRTHATLQLTLAGGAFYRNDRAKWILPAGFAWFDVIPGPFEYGHHPPGLHDQVFLSLDGDAAFALYRMVVDRFGHVLDLRGDSAVREQMLGLARGYGTKTMPNRYDLSARLHHLFASIMTTLSAGQSAREPRIQEASRLIDKRLTDIDLSVHALATELGWGREHFTRQFKQTTGLSVQAYITRRRLRLAGHLLRTTRRTLDVVAADSGLRSANYLCRMFRQHVGVSPDEFRRRTWITIG
jgi:AraC-like DNA-binding protein